MAYIKWGVLITIWSAFAGFLHYTLPQYDVVRIVNTYEERQELDNWKKIFWSTPDSQTQAAVTRDVQFIQAFRANGDAIVYRNEDTGWHWPPYFKFDTANLYSEANDAISTKDNPEWVSVLHYGWRSVFLSTFPNAISIKPVTGPEDKPFNWISTVILVLLAALFWAIYVRWRRFRRSRIDPMLEDVEDGFYAAGDALSERRSRLRRWFSSWRN
ncbi:MULTISPECIES: DUF1523 family protein [Pseudophaeobacter]|jgi:hypothetical protein|uniref:DUF1523 family protein n=1 Tax=Pseudophaeobacter TaxID=1541822 RepID=UPI0024309069|nr:DUF1523 family protein [Pseudophaeobacter profundi]